MASSPDRGVAGSNPRRPCVTASANVSAAERHIVRRACVPIVGWSAGTQVRPAGEGTPYSPTPVVGRHHLDLDAGLAVQPRNVATQTEGSIIYALGQCCGRRSPSGTAASWNPTTPATKVTHVGRVQHRDQGGVDRQSSDRRRPGRNLRSSAPTQRSGPRLGVVDIIQVADRLSERS
jgi:hypothetical protein